MWTSDDRVRCSSLCLQLTELQPSGSPLIPVCPAVRAFSCLQPPPLSLLTQALEAAALGDSAVCLWGRRGMFAQFFTPVTNPSWEVPRQHSSRVNCSLGAQGGSRIWNKAGSYLTIMLAPRAAPRGPAPASNRSNEICQMRDSCSCKTIHVCWFIYQDCGNFTALIRY